MRRRAEGKETEPRGRACGKEAETDGKDVEVGEAKAAESKLEGEATCGDGTPAVVRTLLAAGVWPADARAAQRQNLKDHMLTTEGVIRHETGGEEEALYLYAPPFRTVEQDKIANPESWEGASLRKAKFDPSSCLVIGDFGLGSDTVICVVVGDPDGDDGSHGAVWRTEYRHSRFKFKVDWVLWDESLTNLLNRLEVTTR